MNRSLKRTAIFIALIFTLFTVWKVLSGLAVKKEQKIKDEQLKELGSEYLKNMENAKNNQVKSQPEEHGNESQENLAKTLPSKSLPTPMKPGRIGPSFIDQEFERHQRESVLKVSKPKPKDTRIPKQIFADLKTSFGTITILLKPQIAPKTVENFIGLAEGKIKTKNPETFLLENRNFYDGTLVHRLIHGYFIQTGAPHKDGTGGSGYTIPDEFNTRGTEVQPGMVIMANSGKETASSQFFITVSEMQGMLADENTVFGQVVDGYHILKKISEVKTDIYDRPREEIKINEIKIRRIYAEGSKSRVKTISPVPTLNSSPESLESSSPVPSPLTSSRPLN